MTEKLIIENRKSLSAQNVAEVKAFCQTEITLELKDKQKLIIWGDGLKIVSFNKETGEFAMVGEVRQLRFAKNKLKQFFVREK